MNTWFSSQDNWQKTKQLHSGNEKSIKQITNAKTKQTNLSDIPQLLITKHKTISAIAVKANPIIWIHQQRQSANNKKCQPAIQPSSIKELNGGVGAQENLKTKVLYFTQRDQKDMYNEKVQDTRYHHTNTKEIPKISLSI